MKLILTAALLAALATPLAASAQTYPAEGAAPATTQGQPVPRLYKRWSTLLNGLNLSSQQHDQIQNILDQFAQAHPPGSPKDPNAVKTMRQQIFAVLNPQQQEQLRQNMRQMRIQSYQRRLQQQQREQQPGAETYPYPQPATTTNP